MNATFIPAPFRLGVSRFWQWWSGELLGVLPDGLRDKLFPTGQRLVVDFAGQRVHFLRSKGGVVKRVGSIVLSDPELAVGPERGQVQAVRRIVERAGLESVVGLVRLPREKVLRRLVDLPAAAAENLREVLSFEMDRQTPFKADEVCFDYRIRSRDPERKRIKVDLVVVPREVIARVMRLAEAWGIDLDLLDLSVKVPQDDQFFDLLPRARREARDRLRRRLTFAAATLSVLMLCAALYLPLQAKYARLAALEAELVRARTAATKVDEMRRQVQDLTTRSRYVVEQKNNQRTATEVLNEVTRLLPDSTWVLKFGLRNNLLSLSGYSAKPSALIGLLEDSEMFASVRFSSPVTMDQKVGLERFNLTASILGRNG